MKTEPWQIVAARFCVERNEFTLKELQDFLRGLPYMIPEDHIRNFFIENIQHPSGRQFNRDPRKLPDVNETFWTAPSELVSMITDYDELKEARKNARNAWWFSLLALGATALGAWFQFLTISN